MNDALQRLQEKIAYLERHVVEQDKAMLEMAERIDRLRQELTGLRERMPAAAAGETGGGPAANERPPHY